MEKSKKDVLIDIISNGIINNNLINEIDKIHDEYYKEFSKNIVNKLQNYEVMSEIYEKQLNTEINDECGKSIYVLNIVYILMGNMMQSRYLDDKDGSKAYINIKKRLLAKCLLSFKEILFLAENGFFEGAYIIWRVLYENLVILAYIEQQNNNDMYYRYSDYSKIINIKNLINKYKKAKLDIDLQSFLKNFLKQLRDNNVVIKMPKSCKEIDDLTEDQLKGIFKNITNYGWYINKEKIDFKDFKRIGFRRILNSLEKEDKFGLFNMSIGYDEACEKIHLGNSKNILSLELCNEEIDKIPIGKSSCGINIIIKKLIEISRPLKNLFMTIEEDESFISYGEIIEDLLVKANDFLIKYE